MGQNNIEFIEREQCCICQNSNLTPERNIYDFDTNLGTFNLLKCPKCNMYYTSPYPNEETLPNLYEIQNTRNFDSSNNVFFEYIKDYCVKKHIKSILKNTAIKNNSIVDFGCGNGRFVCQYKELYPSANVTAVDFSKTAPQKLQNCESDIKYISTENFWNDEKKYDIIFLFHVIEHVENPKIFLNKLLNKVNDGGFIYLETPNIKNGLSILFNKWLPSYYPPYHLVHYTPDNLKYIFEKMNVKYQISQTEMPLMSNILANITGIKLNNYLRLLGMILHPIQMLLCCKNHTVLTAKISRKN